MEFPPYSRRLGKFIVNNPLEEPKRNKAETVEPDFTAADIPNLEKTIVELGKIEKFLKEEIIPLVNRLDESKKNKLPGAAQLQEKLEAQWSGAVDNFGNLPQEFLSKLEKIKLANYIACENASELITLLGLRPHIAKAYGSETQKMIADVTQVKFILFSYLETLKPPES